MALHVSRHAEVRTQQRGLRHDDVCFVYQHGTETAKGYLLTRKMRRRLKLRPVTCW